ncbi:MAG TPA: stage II sporulation protein M [Fimbriimonadaceae bacterium]|nr:stage II sporulation protein M [Fimbriimonadaceae bacterium]
MHEAEFVQQREPDWRRLSVLCDKADVSPARLERAELTEFVRLYRRASADLAWARSLSANTELAAFLNGLVGRAYGILYRRPRIRLLPALQSILATGAQVVRRRAWFIFASLAIFLFGIFSTAFIFATRPDLTHYFIQPGDPNLEHWKKGEFEERDVSTAFAATGMYSTNNPTVALRIGTFSAATFGFGTFYFMYANGALLGAYGYELAQVGHLDFLLVNVAPHGASELTGAIIAGASGLVLGWAMIAPGRRSRSDALRVAGKDAFVLLVMSVAMMFIAAPVEGFFSFNPTVPAAVKVAFAALMLTAWLLYWIGYAREPQTPETAP